MWYGQNYNIYIYMYIYIYILTHTHTHTHTHIYIYYTWAFQVALVVKNSPTNVVDLGFNPGFGRSPRGGHGNPL